MSLISEHCKKQNCNNYIEWEYMGLPLISCKLQGESAYIEKRADNCPFNPPTAEKE